MPREFGRNQRVAQFIREELATLIQREFPLNQFGMISISHVDVSPDLKNVTIYISLLGERMPYSELMAALNDKAKHFRHELSGMMTSRGVPVIRFKYDEAPERAQRLNGIIESVSSKDNND